MDSRAPRLEVVAGKAAGMSILIEDELLIGRHSEGAGRLADDDEISRAHARVALDNSGFCAIEDLGSTNGTYVNGLRISSPQTLAVGDTIEIGATTLVVREVPSGADAAAAESPGRRHTIAAGIRTGPEGPAAPSVDPAPPPNEAVGPAPPLDPLVPTEAFSAAGPAAEALPPAPGEPVGEEPEPIPTLELRLEVDFSARAARLFVDRASEPVRLVFDEGAWRADSPELNQKGSTA